MPKGRTPGIVIAGFVLSIFGFACLVPAILGLIFGIVGIGKSRAAGSGRGLSIAAIIIGSAWIVAALVVGIVVAASGGASSKVSQEVSSSPSDEATDGTAAGGDQSTTHSVTYEIDAVGGSISNVTYLTVADGKSGTSQATKVRSPFIKTIELPSSFLDFQMFSLLGQGDESTSSISCKISVDGKVIASESSSGPFSVVSCSGSN